MVQVPFFTGVKQVREQKRTQPYLSGCLVSGTSASSIPNSNRNAVSHCHQGQSHPYNSKHHHLPQMAYDPCQEAQDPWTVKTKNPRWWGENALTGSIPRGYGPRNTPGMLGSNCKTLLCLRVLVLQWKAEWEAEHQEGAGISRKRSSYLKQCLGKSTYFQSTIFLCSAGVWLELYMADTFHLEPKMLSDLEKQSL